VLRFLAGSSIAAASGGRPEADTPGLREIGQQIGIAVGAASAMAQIDEDPGLRAALLREVAVLVPENDLKMAVIRPAPGRVDFSAFDRLATFADRYRRQLRGHTLVWHRQNPAWLPGVLQEAARPSEFLRQHIELVAGRYRGHIHSWDVVNEAIDPDSDRTDGMRNSLWLTAIGPDYVEQAFRFANAADPNARLVYNDFGFEYATPEGSSRRTALLRLLDRLLRRNTPIHAVGVQSHLDPAAPFAATEFARFLEEIAARGFDIYLTELDVSDRALPPDIAARDLAVASCAYRYLSAALSVRQVRMLVTWGLSDRFSWLNSGRRARADGLPSRGLPLDDAMRRKKLWFAIARAFQEAPRR
jgi:endo-1,4-beta-xylanase